MTSTTSDGSDFNDVVSGDHYSSSSKRLKLTNIEEGEIIGSPILSLHTDWVQRETEDRVVNAYVGSETDGPIPVPQSDFEIEINSSGQDGNHSPAGQEISLSSSNSITIPIEPRILTIDTRLNTGHTTIHSTHNTVINDNDNTTVTIQSSLPTEGSTVSMIPSTSMGSQPTDFSSLMRPPNMIQVNDQQQSLITHNDLPGGQFIQTTSGDGTSSGGPLYVMIPPTSNSAEFLQAMQNVQQRPIVPRLSSGAIVSPVVTDENKTHKDIMRKQTHNEVERRRRDRINELIKILAEVVPGCQKKDSSNGNIVGYVYSKGTVLEKTVEYVRELILQNDQLAATAKLAEKSASAIQLLQNQITVLEKENTFLRAQMVQLGIDNNTSNSLSGARSLLTNPLAQSLLSSQLVPQPQPTVVPPVMAPPPQPIAAVPNNNTSQLLVSLAQTLTNNPLLASLSQQSSPPTLTQQSSTNNTAPTMNNNSINDTPNITQVNTQQQASLPPANNQANLLMNSLVQTLANIANTTSNTPQAPPPPPPTQASGLSATAAMSLLNSLIMAQNTNTSQQAATTANNNTQTAHLLVSPNSQEKTISSPSTTAQ